MNEVLAATESLLYIRYMLPNVGHEVLEWHEGWKPEGMETEYNSVKKSAKAFPSHPDTT